MTDAELDSINEQVGDKLLHNCKCLEPAFDRKCVCMPDYSRSIAAAWEIVHKFHSMGLMRTLEGHWYCVPKFCLSEKNEDEWYMSAEENDFDSLADTAPLAICKAFLKLR